MARTKAKIQEAKCLEDLIVRKMSHFERNRFTKKPTNDPETQGAKVYSALSYDVFKTNKQLHIESGVPAGRVSAAIRDLMKKYPIELNKNGAYRSYRLIRQDKVVNLDDHPIVC